MGDTHVRHASTSRLKDFLEELRCPICKDILNEPYATECGHTFCHGCICTHLSNRQKCPCCSTFLTEKSIHPIFALEKMVSRAAQVAAEDAAPPVERLKSLLSSTPQLQSCSDIDDLIKVLKTRRQGMSERQHEVNLHLLLHFLQRAKHEMLHRMQQVESQMRCLNSDISKVKDKREALSLPALPPQAGRAATAATLATATAVPTSTTSAQPAQSAGVSSQGVPRQGGTDPYSLLSAPRAVPDHDPAQAQGRADAPANASTAADSQLEALTSKLIAKKKGVVTQFNEFQALYLSMCATDVAQKGPTAAGLDSQPSTSGQGTDASAGSGSGTAAQGTVMPPEDRLSEFGHMLAMATQILIHRIHKPHQEVTGSNRVSSLSWSYGTREHLIHCGSPEGSIHLWNVATAQELRKFEGHVKRVWSLHYSPREHPLFVSGSDDTTVKIWSANRREAVKSINVGYNVCCVQFSPDDPNLIAVGSAGHIVSIYDLRHLPQPLSVLQGHRKALSYVRFMGGKQLVSGSVDNSLILWDLPTTTLVRKYSGHTNKKNFVGMSVNGNYIACGSENSQVHVYYKQVSHPILDYSFTQASTSETSCFTSAVAWKPNSTHLLAASSHGNVAILAMSDS